MVLEDALGAPVAGFRAPGYNLSPALIEAVAGSGATYSSSRFPSPPYFLAKWSVMLSSALRGRPSGSIRGEITAPFRSRHPYHHEGGLLELPMSVIPRLRLPAIGTFFTLYGARGPALLLPLLRREPWLNIEFHGVDLLDAQDPGVDPLVARHQPDLPRPVADKRALFLRWLRGLRPGHRPRTLAQIASKS